MGMAASQARYLALVARKSNCEYEGQQINQARTVLANQSANLFNQMLGLNVPVPPNTSDFTKTQYSYKDGTNASTISSWQQLSAADPEYNYVVTHHYYTDKYTGSMKKLADPQVQFKGNQTANSADIMRALQEINEKEKLYNEAKAAREELETQYSTLETYLDKELYAGITNSVYEVGKYTITNAAGDSEFLSYDSLYETTVDPVTGATISTQSETQKNIDALIEKLVETGALDEKYLTDKSELFYCNGSIAFAADLNSLVGGTQGATNTTLPVLNITDVETEIATLDANITTKQLEESTALINYNNAKEAYENLQHPTYIGNSELTPLASLDADQMAEVNQIVTDMLEQGIDAEIINCFDANGNYTGGLYSFKLNGTLYYTTYNDLQNSYASGTGNNHIDGQIKMPYYNASYVSTKIEETEKALLETDETGRFTSVRFENDTVTYTLNVETTTDEAAYQDAMNQFYYESAVYDKTVQEINAKTSIIHQEDMQLELRLKQLDTERNALSTEMDAVKKVVDDNVEKSFKTFNS